MISECSNANIASPRAIVMTAQLGAYLGFAVILVIAYTIRDVSDVVLSSFGQPFASLCIQVLGKEAGLAMLSLNALAQFFCGLGCLVTTTRVVFAYSRDGAIVGSRWWSRVDPRTKTPVLATWGVLFIAALLALLIFAGPIAIGAVFSIGGCHFPVAAGREPSLNACRRDWPVHSFHDTDRIEAVLQPWKIRPWTMEPRSIFQADQCYSLRLVSPHRACTLLPCCHRCQLERHNNELV